MAISVTCACGKKLQARDEHAGKKAKCPGCGALLVVPEKAPWEDGDEYALMDAPANPAPAAFTPRPVAEMPSSFAPAPKPRPTAAAPAPVASGSTWREYAYWLLLLAFLPLGFSLVNKER